MNMLMVIWIGTLELNIWYHGTCIYMYDVRHVQMHLVMPCPCEMFVDLNFTSQWWAGRDRSLVDGLMV